jgi:Putative 2OG-Fe(II) oxygenase
MSDVFGIFPTPVMRCPAVLDAPLVEGLLQYFAGSATLVNSSSTNLSHTAMLKPGDSPLLVEVARRITPQLAGFGALIMGEQLGWSLKEMWVNLLDPGGRQAMHNHANSFISGVVYLTPTHPDSRTVFMRSPGGHDFAFRNDHAGVVTGPYNADKWISPQPDPGDLTLFPSYLMHAVPPNAGDRRRVTLAFNAIPTHVDSWGYRIGFSG